MARIIAGHRPCRERRCVRLARLDACRSGRSGTLIMNSVGVVVSERLARYGFGDGHPFGSDRLAAFLREFAVRGLPQRVTTLEPRQASDAELRSFHTAE